MFKQLNFLLYSGLIGLFLSSQFISAQPVSKDQLAIEYVDKFKDFAVDEMHRSGIPASITLAQGLLESDYGRSRLAVLANNHFGLKCHNTWDGETILHDDDALQECFRKFPSVYDSYQNHSKILKKKRYQFLYSIDRKDYQAWSHGLRKAGYATDPYYGYKLIRLIESYSLYVYDYMEYIPPHMRNSNKEVYVYHPPKRKVYYELASLNSRSVESIDDSGFYTVLPKRSHKIGKLPLQKPRKVNGKEVVKYSIEVWPVQVSEIYNVSLEELIRLNDLEHNQLIPPFTNIFLEERKRKGSSKREHHIVRVGDDMRKIALSHGIQLSSLYGLNRMKVGTEAVPGEVLYLRSKAPYVPRLYTPLKEHKESPSEIKELDPLHFVNDSRIKYAAKNEDKKESRSNSRSKNEPAKHPAIVEYKQEEFVVYHAPAKGRANPPKEPKVESKMVNRTVDKFDSSKTAEQTSSKQTLVYDPVSRVYTANKPVSNSDYRIKSVSHKNNLKPSIVKTTSDTRVVRVVEPSSVEISRTTNSVKTHQVKTGENLYRISLKYGLTVLELKSLNNLKSDKIRVGMNLKIRK